MKPSRDFALYVLCFLIAQVTAAKADLVYSFVEEPSAGPPYLIVSGEISPTEDIAKFSAAVSANQVSVVTFDSPGGSVEKAIELGRRIRSLGMSTFQIRAYECASACALAFLGGVSRTAEPGSIGVHRSYFSPDASMTRDEAVQAIQQVTARVSAHIREMGADPALLELSLSIDSADMRYLTGSEMVQYRVTTIPGIETPLSVANLPLTAPIPVARPHFPLLAAYFGGSTEVIKLDPKAIFYEERTNVAEGSAEPGTIVWSLLQESPGDDLPPEPAIHGEATIPGKDLLLRMTIHRNVDKTLPASHVIELILLTPENFDGGGIESILRVSLKYTEEAAGNPLLGMPAKVGDDFFLVALNDTKAEIETNLALMKRNEWIDVPLVYKSGRRALFTLEKGPTGDKVFDDAMDAWSKVAPGAGEPKIVPLRMVRSVPVHTNGPVTVLPPAAAPAAPIGAWSVQIATAPSSEGAKSSYADLVRRFESVIGDRDVNFVKAEISGKGTYWRVSLPAESRDDAIKLCGAYKIAGGNCFVSRLGNS